MERSIYLLVWISGMLTFGLNAQNNQTIYNAYVLNEMGKWKMEMNLIEAIKFKSNSEILDLINYQYGYIGWCIGQELSDEAEMYIEKASANILQLEKKSYSMSMIYAYKAAIIGYEIGLAPYKAPFIGSNSFDFATKSVAIDPANALGYIQLGNIAYYKPSILGGSKSEAIEHYNKALVLMEANKTSLVNNWNYLNLLAILVNCHIELKNYREAELFCLKALGFEPQFAWVKHTLYPQVLKQLK